jgi:hypothetical protein
MTSTQRGAPAFGDTRYDTAFDDARVRQDRERTPKSAERHRPAARPARLLSALVLATCMLAAPSALARTGVGEPGSEIVAGTAETVRDFMIQNVCLDPGGAVVSNRSPVADEGGCTVQRDLRPGEPLPYHKHDHPSPDQRAGAPLGYQRHNSFPVKTAGFGVVVEHSFDFGSGEGRRFGVFDRGSDGGDVAILSRGVVSIGATEDGGNGFQLFVGECRGPVNSAALTRSWVIAEFDPDQPAPLQGQTVVRLKDLVKGQQQTCPARFSRSFTSWRVAPFLYRAVAGQGKLITLTSLISDHYGGGNPDTADHVERFYFTRELGGTRWERWQNVRGNAQFSAALIAQRGEWFARTERCSPAEPPAGAQMVLIDCREWTQIVPPDDAAGDPPAFWIEELRSRPGTPAFFYAPAGERHKQ